MQNLVKSVLIVLGLLFAIGTTLGFTAAHAEIVQFEESGAGVVFKIDGKQASAPEAVQAAPKHVIEKCTPVKGALALDGKTSVLAYKCKIVALMYNPKTGMPKWKVR